MVGQNSRFTFFFVYIFYLSGKAPSICVFTTITELIYGNYGNYRKLFICAPGLYLKWLKSLQYKCDFSSGRSVLVLGGFLRKHSCHDNLLTHPSSLVNVVLTRPIRVYSFFRIHVHDQTWRTAHTSVAPPPPRLPRVTPPRLNPRVLERLPEKQLYGPERATPPPPPKRRLEPASGRPDTGAISGAANGS